MSATPNSGVALQFDALTVPLDAGVTLVEASAGTGKTFAITRLVLRMLLERKVANLSQILVVTFTEKATQELVTRIRTTLRVAAAVWSGNAPERNDANNDLFLLREQHGDAGREIVQQALASLDDLAVSTIHGFCHRVLSESALETGVPFRTTFIQDESEPLQRAARDWGRNNLLANTELSQLLVANDQSIEGWIKPLVFPYRRQEHTRIEFDQSSVEQSTLADFVTTVDRSFNDEKQHRHLMGFDDLLRKLSRVLVSEGPQGPLATRIRTRFGAALIDEFQDTDRTQFPIFATAFAGCPLFLIGDPKQSIFRFRGADIASYLQASRDATRKYTLLKNYRSSPAYVRAVEHLFTHASDPFGVPEEEIGFPSVSAARNPSAPAGLSSDGRAAMEWWWVDGSLGAKGKFVSKEHAFDWIMHDIANEIVRLHNNGLAYKSVAVLVRTNVQARLVKRALDRAHVPAVVGADADVLESDEATEVTQIAIAIAAPHDGRAVRSAMATRLWGCDSASIAATLREDGEAAWTAITGRLTAARDSWRVRGVASALGELFAERNSSERLLRLSDGERRLTNLRHVVELLHEAWANEGLPPEGLASWIATERLVPNTPGRRELRLETDSAAVQILTIHKAKGLEFDVVFCPALWESFGERKGPFGIVSALVDESESSVLDLGTDKSAQRCMIVREQESQENLRLAYVALTRAVHRCYVAWGEIGKEPIANSALGHLMRNASGLGYRDALQALVANSEGTMRFTDVLPDAVRATAPYEQESSFVADALPLDLASGQLNTWRATSFTGLSSSSHHDAVRDVVDVAAPPTEQPEKQVASGFRAFPAGAQAGVALHEVFERIDFQRSTEADVLPAIKQSLAAYGLTGSDLIAAQRAEDVAHMVSTVCAATIPHAGFALRDVPNSEVLKEWRFDLSVHTVSVRRIADVLAQFGSLHAKAYAPALRLLRDSDVSGYLGGIVDVAFEHQGKWWLVDWKSNQLGASDFDYAPDALATAMMNAHYTLQYHLYLVALHRHLKVRQPGYDPAIHWGRVAYVFLRGVTGADDGGWFLDAPTPALLDALDAALGKRV